MWKLLIAAILILNQDKVFGSTDVARQNEMPGPVSHIMENLSIHTRQVADDLTAQLASNIDGTSQTIVGDIEVILTSAMEQLTETIVAAQSRLEDKECQELLSLDELRHRVDAQLSACTANLNDVLLAFQNDSEDFSKALDGNVQEIVYLPSQCENTAYNFGSIAACFIDKITEVNRDMAVVLNRASMTILQTLQLAKQGTEAARICADHVVADTADYMDLLMTKCQNIVE